MASKYGKSSQREVKKELHRFKKGTAVSGPKLKKVKSRKQAIAIALSKARKKGAKVPPPPLDNKPGKMKRKSTKTALRKKAVGRKRTNTASKRRTSTRAKAKKKA